MALRSASATATQAASPAQSGNLSPLQIAQVAYTAGFRGTHLTMAVAISLAETGGTGNPKAVSPTHDYGLWQINQPAHPTYFKQSGKIFEPGYNAAAAYAISKGGTDWTPWTTYKSQAYKAYYGKGIPTGPGADAIIGSGARSGTGGGWLPGVPGIPNPVKWVDEAAHAIVDFLKIMVDPVKLGEHAAKVILWLIRKLSQGIYVVFVLPPWRWAQRSTIWYWENIIVADARVGGQRFAISVKAIATMGFWAVGYAILWGRFEPPEHGVPAAESAFANTLASGRNAVISRRIVKPKDVEAKTADKPKETVSSLPLEITRTVAATRRRTVKVQDGRSGTEGTEAATQDQRTQDAGTPEA